MNLGITGKVALVTGGSAGIGRAVAIQLAAEGVKVALTYHSQKDSAEQLGREIGGIALPLTLDDPGSAVACVKQTIEKLGSIDILVNNAVMWGDQWGPGKAKFEDVPLEQWQKIFRGNFEGTYAAIQAALPTMRANKWGRIINLSSGTALDGVSGTSPYASAKSASHGLTSVLARELGAEGILVNVVVPGITLTERVAKHVTPELEAARAAGYPIKRLLPPDEVAPTIVFLASALNTAVTGETIRASGGRPYPY
ncbi:MAG: SDR family oxidoreductase [Kofleriaceae bacterium]